MHFVNILGIAAALSMDALAVAVTNGFLIKKLKLQHALRIAFTFGFFQAIMPLIGWLGGLGFRKYIAIFDHWLAFSLLVFVGGKMIYEAF
ncbi:MAG TPA: manganese efflux pump, partial [Spirochaetota bacterium]|nr:manganese efflux pump [Spirochaetota bacterium]